MKVINDKVLGELTFDVFWSRPYKVGIFGLEKEITLVIQTFDNDDITNNQRQTFDDFEKNKQRIISDVENEVLNYYRDNFESKASNASDVAGLVDLLKIKIMYSEAGEDQEIGFIFSASFDPELGVGVLISNGKVEDVDVQDIVLG